MKVECSIYKKGELIRRKSKTFRYDLFKKPNKYLQCLALATCCPVASDGSPGPALLTARTLNW